MSTLYTLTENYNNLIELLDNPEIEPEVLEQSLNEVAEQIEVKAENIAKLIKNIDGDIEAIKNEEKRLAEKKRSLEAKKLRIKEYLYGQIKLLENKKVKTPLFSIAIQKNPPSVAVESEENIPECYYIIKKELSKKDLLGALKDGLEIKGVKIVQSEGIRIR